ncbi:MAG: hypothetical protein AAFQ68_01325 [Bacteroidota bacterium]
MARRWIAGMSLLTMLVFLVACQPSRLPQKEYAKWIQAPENGLHKTKEVGAYRIETQFLPADMMASLSMRGPYQKAKWEDAIQAKQSELNFQLSLSTLDRQETVLRYDLESPAEYQDRVYYFSYEIEHDIRLIAGEDTLKPILCHFVRSYDLSPNLKCMLTFERSAKQTSDIRLIWEDNLLGMGPLHFNFDPQQLENTPALILK